MTEITTAYVVGKLAQGAGVAVINKVFSKKALSGFMVVYEYCFVKGKKTERLYGHWEGDFKQENGRHKGDYKIIIEFHNVPGKDVAAGIGLYWDRSIKKPEQGDFEALAFTGSCEKNGYLRLDFRNVDKSEVQFGTIIATLGNGDKTIAEKTNGSGYARWTSVSISDGGIVYGRIKLKRKGKNVWDILDGISTK